MKDLSAYFIKISDVSENDNKVIGAKNYNLKMLRDAGLPIPETFALTTNLFRDYMWYNDIRLDEDSSTELSFVNKIRSRILRGTFTEEMQAALKKVYDGFKGQPLAVRSSSTLEDLKQASFSGQYDSFINVTSEQQMLDAVKGCYASLFSERVLSYLELQNVSLSQLDMGIVIQPTVDAVASGVVFTVDPLSKSNDVLYIESNFGYGESVVGGQTNTDKYFMYKKNRAILKKILGTKDFCYEKNRTGGLAKRQLRGNSFALNNRMLAKISELAVLIEQHFGCPQDIEFAVSTEGAVVILQARPLLIEPEHYITISTLIDNTRQPIGTGLGIVKGVATGPIGKTSDHVHDGAIVAADTLEVYDIPKLKKAAGLIVTDLGPGSHAASIIREYKIPTLTAPSLHASKLLSQVVTIDTTGQPAKIYAGEIQAKQTKLYLDRIPPTEVEVFVGCSSSPTLADLKHAPLAGVGLVRAEFIINNEIGVHPLALLEYDAGKLDTKLRRTIGELIQGYASAADFFVGKVSDELSMIMALVPGKPVNYRLSDFQSDSYKGLIGGERYEKNEANPMMGFRGTTRLISDQYQDVLKLEVEALKVVQRKNIGELRVMAPFCRLPGDGQILRQRLRKYGLTDTRIGMMVELSSNIILAEEFADVFDFFFVGPRDLTQNLYGADRALPELLRYAIDGPATKKAVVHFLREITGKKKEVFIALFDLYKHIDEFKAVQSNNIIRYSGSPSSILEDFTLISRLEKSARRRAR